MEDGMAVDQSLKGAFLLDSGKLKGSFFEKTVIYLCQHDLEGSLGFVINRPTGSTLGKVVEANLPESIKSLPLYLGGPVQTDVLSYLHADGGLIKTNIVPGIEFGNSIEGLLELVGNYSPSKEIKVFGGYSGWGSGQLEQELKSGAWFVHQSSIDSIFSIPGKDIWNHLLAEMGPEYKLISQQPDDPSLN